MDDSPKQAPAPKTEVAVLDPALLAQLDAQGFSLGKLVAGIDAKSTLELDAHPGFRSIFEALRADLADTKRRFPLARPTSIDGFRQFDARWFRSKEMFFQLTGIFNRLDRRAFYQGNCGELRFVYRLRFETEQGGKAMTGRLPMTVNVVFLLGAGAEGTDRSRTERSHTERSRLNEAGAPCRDAARAWQHDTQMSEDSLATWLLAGPLSEARRKQWSLKSVETNLQTIRLQSTVHVTLAGHVEYAMHVFHPEDETRRAFFFAPMENMPDVKRITADKALREELLSLLENPEFLDAADQGTLQLPERFLATRLEQQRPGVVSDLRH